MLEGAILRDEGIAKVLANQTDDWKDKARSSSRDFIFRLPVGASFTGEDVRLAAQTVAGQPIHHNAWGGIIGSAIKDALRIGFVELVGLAPARSKSAHARRYPQYRVKGLSQAA